MPRLTLCTQGPGTEHPPGTELPGLAGGALPFPAPSPTRTQFRTQRAGEGAVLTPAEGLLPRPGTPPPAAPPYQRPPGKVPLAFVIPSQQVPPQGLDLSRVAKEMLGGRRGRRRSWGPCQESGAGSGLAAGPGCGTTGPEAGPRQSRRRVDEHRLPGLTRTQ